MEALQETTSGFASAARGDLWPPSIDPAVCLLMLVLVLVLVFEKVFSTTSTRTRPSPPGGVRSSRSAGARDGGAPMPAPFSREYHPEETSVSALAVQGEPHGTFS
jgi:hypothetical protein